RRCRVRSRAATAEEHPRPVVWAGRRPLPDTDLPGRALAATLDHSPTGPEIEGCQGSGELGGALQHDRAFGETRELCVGEVDERPRTFAHGLLEDEEILETEDSWERGDHGDL